VRAISAGICELDVQFHVLFTVLPSVRIVIRARAYACMCVRVCRTANTDPLLTLCDCAFIWVCEGKSTTLQYLVFAVVRQLVPKLVAIHASASLRPAFVFSDRTFGNKSLTYGINSAY